MNAKMGEPLYIKALKKAKEFVRAQGGATLDELDLSVAQVRALLHLVEYESGKWVTGTPVTMKCLNTLGNKSLVQICYDECGWGERLTEDGFRIAKILKANFGASRGGDPTPDWLESDNTKAIPTDEQIEALPERDAVILQIIKEYAMRAKRMKDTSMNGTQISFWEGGLHVSGNALVMVYDFMVNGNVDD